MGLTEGIIGACILLSFWAWAQERPSALWVKWGLSPYAVRHHSEWYRLFTSLFFHGEIVHLLVNSLVFYSFGRPMERYYGWKAYLVLLFIGALASGLLTLWRYREDYRHLSIGLSGVVSAVLFAYILHYPRATLLLFGLLPLPAWVFALLYVGYSLYAAFEERSFVNHWAHLGGALGGLAFAYLT
ncbi:MAG: rhomboid family intramembrane serine protease [Bacteroidia bacterium]|nr:rhomboid family intramembrane serine protease [Bacteroidia bacterium]MDW8089064.1 rhomboid family intramembrane serine protease [Bacteroidia bacterium]